MALPPPVTVRVPSAVVVTVTDCDWLVAVCVASEWVPAPADVVYSPETELPVRVADSLRVVVVAAVPAIGLLDVLSQMVEVVVAESVTVVSPLKLFAVVEVVRVESANVVTVAACG